MRELTKFFKNKGKWILGLLIPTAFAASLIGELNTGQPVKEPTATISKDEDAYFKTNKTYFEKQDSTYDTTDYKSKVFNYLTPKREWGYHILYVKKENGVISEKAVGFGAEAANRTYDWKIVGTYSTSTVASTTP